MPWWPRGQQAIANRGTGGSGAPNIVSVGRAIVTPEGFTEPRVPVELGPPSVVAEADGSFVFETLVENPQGVWRTGQRVRAQVTLPSVDGLSWLSERL